MKICSKCKEAKPATAEFFNACKSQNDGLHRYCKNCQREYWAKYVSDKNIKNSLNAKRMKRYNENPQKDIEYSKHWQKANPEKVKEIKKKHSIVRSKHIVERVNKWIQENPIHRRLLRQRVRVPDNANCATIQEFLFLFESNEKEGKYKCAYCDKYYDFTEITIDHIIPISKNGKNNIENLNLACLPCNARKGSNPR